MLTQKVCVCTSAKKNAKHNFSILFKFQVHRIVRPIDYVCIILTQVSRRWWRRLFCCAPPLLITRPNPRVLRGFVRLQETCVAVSAFSLPPPRVSAEDPLRPRYFIASHNGTHSGGSLNDTRCLTCTAAFILITGAATVGRIGFSYSPPGKANSLPVSTHLCRT